MYLSTYPVTSVAREREGGREGDKETIDATPEQSQLAIIYLDGRRVFYRCTYMYPACSSTHFLPSLPQKHR